jgi:hypothetical protein
MKPPRGNSATWGMWVLIQTQGDIIGAVAVHGGLLVPDSYQPNTNHQLLTADGLFVLPPELEIALEDEVRTRCAHNE